MKILITGSSGFIGTNLKKKINSIFESKLLQPEFYEFNETDDLKLLSKYSVDCDFVFHLAAVHRPLNETDFETINIDLFDLLLNSLNHNSNKCPVVLTSSIQALDDTPYGRSKLAAEKLLTEFSKINGNKAIIYRLTNTFGRYAKPNSHSVVATFCYNISHSLPIQISNPNHELQLYYIDDVCESLISHIINKPISPDSDGIFRLSETLTYKITLGKLAEIIQSFTNENYNENNDILIDKLYKTYYYYLKNN